MKLYMREKVFSWTERFTIRDENGADRYYVEGELFSWGKKLHVYGMDGAEAALIQQKVWSLLPKYHVFVGGEQIAEIVKEFTFLFPRYRIDGLGWKIEGRFMKHDYQITCHDQPIMTLHKEWTTWGDCYELDISDPRDEIVAMAVALAIDCDIEAAAAAASSD